MARRAEASADTIQAGRVRTEVGKVLEEDARPGRVGVGILVGTGGIEPPTLPCQGSALPLSYVPLNEICLGASEENQYQKSQLSASGSRRRAAWCCPNSGASVLSSG